MKAADTVTIRRIMMRQSIAGRIISGSKVLPLPGREIRIGTGEIFCFERRSEWQIIQQAALGQPYAAELLLGQDDNDAFSGACGNPPQAFVFHTRPDAALNEAWRQTASSAAPARADILRLLGLLEKSGRRFSQGAKLDTVAQLERLLAGQLHLPWTQTQAAAMLGISPSTLKRRLANSQTTFAALLRRLRLDTALLLLMEQPLPIGAAAAACGYRSAARFTAAFKHRFGFLPSALRRPPRR